MGNVNYLDAPLSPPAQIGGDIEEWIQVYNNSGSDIANGVVKQLAYLVTGGTVAPDDTIVQAVPLAAVTGATESNIVIVIDNNPAIVASTTPVTSYNGIKNASSGFAKTKGVVLALVDGTTDVALGDQLEVITTATSFTQAASASTGASGAIVPECAAIALQAFTDSTPANKYVLLLGKQVQVKGS